MYKGKFNIIEKIKTKKQLKVLFIVLSAIIILGLGFFIYLTSLKTINNQEVELLIYPNDNFKQVKNQLIAEKVIAKSNTSFVTFANALKYTQKIKSGRYIIKPNSSVFNLVRLLRSGSQQPIKVVITNARLTNDFAEKITKHLMITSQDFMQEVKKQGFNYDNELFEYIIPNTYEFFWNISAKSLLDKLKKESEKFWQENQKELKKSGLTKKQIVILASIVSEETNKEDEMPKIAGVYINRLHKDMLLQADPTVKFAVGDFSLRRITGKHLQVNSPFNTYKQKGLPPAPICLPSLIALKSVLQYDRHNYIFFCAKEDFSGYHNFATDVREHINNANRYRKALNTRGIN